MVYVYIHNSRKKHLLEILFWVKIQSTSIITRAITRISQQNKTIKSLLNQVNLWIIRISILYINFGWIFLVCDNIELENIYFFFLFFYLSELNGKFRKIANFTQTYKILQKDMIFFYSVQNANISGMNLKLYYIYWKCFLVNYFSFQDLRKMVSLLSANLLVLVRQFDSNRIIVYQGNCFQIKKKMLFAFWTNEMKNNKFKEIASHIHSELL